MRLLAGTVCGTKSNGVKIAVTQPLMSHIVFAHITTVLRISISWCTVLHDGDCSSITISTVCLFPLHLFKYWKLISRAISRWKGARGVRRLANCVARSATSFSQFHTTYTYLFVSKLLHNVPLNKLGHSQLWYGVRLKVLGAVTWLSIFRAACQPLFGNRTSLIPCLPS